jgi:hypothetical protein
MRTLTPAGIHDADGAKLNAWATRCGISEAYRIYVPDPPSSLARTWTTFRVDLWILRGHGFWCRRMWTHGPSFEQEPTPPERGAPIGDRIAVRVREAFEQTKFFDAPEERWDAGPDQRPWVLLAHKDGRTRSRSTCTHPPERTPKSLLPYAPTGAFDGWRFEAARFELLRVRPSLFRWPRTVAVGL